MVDGSPACGLLFHYSHGGEHELSQGSMDATELAWLIDSFGRERFVDARDFLEQARNDRLAADQLCITLDDGLASQRDVALPVLDAMGLTAFWFVNSSMYRDRPPTLELYRASRSGRRVSHAARDARASWNRGYGTRLNTFVRPYIAHR
jgi:hypothetical protein